ncbi:MAG: carboxypeptidase-like regulatory domain-containing protein, partial [Bacteroidales bacterium]|nr:carboxypeptidase-like regulatory domain-containing protein [Bacteroidales bacterium]
MKNLLKSTIILLVLSIFAVQANATDGLFKKKKNPQDYITVTGKVIDAETKASLIFATVGVQNTNVATVTNLDGEFTLKIAKNLSNPVLEIMYIGYQNKAVPLSELRTNGRANTITLSQATIPIKEVVIKPISPDEIMVNVIKNIRSNYTDVPNQMTSFYRETIKRNRNYVSIAEAVVEIFKAPYDAEFRFDMAKVYKGRKNVEVNRLDTVLFKLQGGPITTLQLDLVKNRNSLLSYESMESYEYTLESIIAIDDKP